MYAESQENKLPRYKLNVNVKTVCAYQGKCELSLFRRLSDKCRHACSLYWSHTRLYPLFPVIQYNLIIAAIFEFGQFYETATKTGSCSLEDIKIAISFCSGRKHFAKDIRKNEWWESLQESKKL